LANGKDHPVCAGDQPFVKPPLANSACIFLLSRILSWV
jgi:hypothetical protein